MDFKSLLPFGRATDIARTGTDADPFVSLRREMDRMFDDFSRGWGMPSATMPASFLSPKVDVAETDKGLELTAELPGVDYKDIDLDLTDGVLTLKAEHKEEKDETDEKKQYHLVERSTGTFLRRFALPFTPDTDKIEATFDKGLLKVMVPRATPPDKPANKIEIKAA